MRKREDVGRYQAVRCGQPAVRPGRVIVRDNEVEIEHETVQLLLAQAGSVEEHGPGRVPKVRSNGSSHCRDARIDGLRQLGRNKRAKVAHAARRRNDTGGVDRRTIGLPFSA